jgi:3-phosphoglycerate kinase
VNKLTYQCTDVLANAAQKLGVEFVLPVDVVVADKFAPDANTKIVDIKDIPDVSALPLNNIIAQLTFNANMS